MIAGKASSLLGLARYVSHLQRYHGMISDRPRSKMLLAKPAGCRERKKKEDQICMGTRRTETDKKEDLRV
jgi:hypothetical protein